MMQDLTSGWDFFQNEILGMKWLSRLMGSAVEACGLDPEGRVGGSIQFLFYDVIKIMVLSLPSMTMPAIVVNEKVVSMGKGLKAADVEKLLRKLG